MRLIYVDVAKRLVCARLSKGGAFQPTSLAALVEAASKGHTHFDFKFDAKQYGFKEFKPKRDDIVANLPHPLKPEYESKKLKIRHGSAFPDYLEFECSLQFSVEADKHLTAIKGPAGATEAEDAAAPASKKVKSEVKAEPP